MVSLSISCCGYKKSDFDPATVYPPRPAMTDEKIPTTDSQPDSLAFGFGSLGLDERLLSTLTSLGYEEPTPIQREAIPLLLAGRDVLGLAATGTGKTAAFALPLLQNIAETSGTERVVSVLVLVPTRELAMQVAGALHRYGKELNRSALPIYGGQSIVLQLRALKRGVDVVVATPGRALDHIERKTLRLDNVRAVVLDEADEMLDMGFADDLEAILKSTPATRQTALFSATIPARIRDIAARHLRDPVYVEIARQGTPDGVPAKVRQTAYVVPRSYKVAALGRVLDMESPTLALVFCRTRREVDELSEALNGRGYRCEALHGGMSQEQRDRTMNRFRSGVSDILIATDVAARGLDIPHLSHVINYDVPSAPESYVHRIGRTGRAGQAGVAITLAEPREQRLLRHIQQWTKCKIAIESVPSVSDLRSRRLDLVRESVRETVLGGKLENFHRIAQSLAEEFDITDIAAAAIKMLDDAGGATNDEQDIPNLPREIEAPPSKARRKLGPASKPVAGKKAGAEQPVKASKRQPKAEWSVARLFIGAGRHDGVRPADLVGAIANELGLHSRAIGAIEIADRHSLVEVPDEIADDIVEALARSTIRGKRVKIRRDRVRT